MKSEGTIAERIAAGAAFLDEHDPDWWRTGVPKAIDLDSLDLGEPDSCVLGQRCPLTVLAEYCDLDPKHVALVHRQRAYSAYADHLSGLTDGAQRDWAASHGFNTPTHEGDCDSECYGAYDALTAEWKRVLTERRETVVPA